MTVTVTRMSAQSITSATLAAAGSFHSATNGSISLSVGQPITGDIATPSLRLHQGFQLGGKITITGIEDERRLIAYPNPTTNELHVTGVARGNHRFQLMDMQGRHIPVSHTLYDEDIVIDLRSVPPAMYILKFHEAGGTTRTAIIIKTN